jgi:alpha-glucosidase
MMHNRPSLQLIVALSLAIVSGFSAVAYAAKWQEIPSPGGDYKIGFSLSENGHPLYRVIHDGEEIITPSGLGFILDGEVPWTAGFQPPELSKRSAHEGAWKPVWGERSAVKDSFTAATVTYPRQIAPGPFSLEVRAYDQGVAFRYLIEEHGGAKEIRISSEETEFNFGKDHNLWAAYSAQGKYRKMKLSKLKGTVERPCVLETGGGKVIAIAEAAMVDFARMRLRPSSGKPHTLVSRLHGPVQSNLPLKTPWRVVMAGDRPGDLLENNDILLNLNEPNKIADTSWIKPGKVIREVTLSTNGGLACVDFAVKYGLDFIEFDAGWYGDQQNELADASTVARSNLDLPRVIKYAQDNEIGVILYVNRRHLEADLDNLLPIYQKWGIAGLKFGFVQHGDQKWTRWMHEAIAKCAKYQIMVDVHDEYRMTGWQRTYPNFMTAEGIGGDETRPPNEQALATLFTRGICAPSDHTFCYYNGFVDQTTSHASQLAKTICFFSAWQFLFWYDQPSSAQNEPELEFFKYLPTTWDDTRVLHGKIGKFAAIARRSGDDWFIGCFNAGDPRILDLDLDFLPKGKQFEAIIYFDNNDLATRTKVGIERRPVDSTTVLKASMSGHGGVAVRIVAK